MFMPDSLKLNGKNIKKSKLPPYVIMVARSNLSGEIFSIKHMCYVSC